MLGSTRVESTYKSQYIWLKCGVLFVRLVFPLYRLLENNISDHLQVYTITLIHGFIGIAQSEIAKDTSMCNLNGYNYTYASAYNI